MEMLTAALAMLVSNLPALIVEGVLLTLAVARWNRYPRVAMFVAAGCVLLLLNNLAAPLQGLLPVKLHDEGRTTTEIGYVLGVIGLVRGVVSTIGVALIGAAAFIDRAPAP